MVHIGRRAIGEDLRRACRPLFGGTCGGLWRRSCRDAPLTSARRGTEGRQTPAATGSAQGSAGTCRRSGRSSAAPSSPDGREGRYLQAGLQPDSTPHPAALRAESSDGEVSTSRATARLNPTPSSPEGREQRWGGIYKQGYSQTQPHTQQPWWQRGEVSTSRATARLNPTPSSPDRREGRYLQAGLQPDSTPHSAALIAERGGIYKQGYSQTQPHTQQPWSQRGEVSTSRATARLNPTPSSPDGREGRYLQAGLQPDSTPHPATLMAERGDIYKQGYSQTQPTPSSPEGREQRWGGIYTQGYSPTQPYTQQPWGQRADEGLKAPHTSYRLLLGIAEFCRCWRSFVFNRLRPTCAAACVICLWTSRSSMTVPRGMSTRRVCFCWLSCVTSLSALSHSAPCSSRMGRCGELCLNSRGTSRPISPLNLQHI